MDLRHLAQVCLFQIVVKPFLSWSHDFSSPTLSCPFVHLAGGMWAVWEEYDGLVIGWGYIVSSCNACRRTGVVYESGFKEQFSLGQGEQTCSVII